jgi:hypothetical protein
VFIAKKLFSEYPRIFSPVDMFDTGILIRLDENDSVECLLLEKTHAPPPVDRFIEDFITQVATQLFEVEYNFAALSK